jgi:hypothetical protein
LPLETLKLPVPFTLPVTVTVPPDTVKLPVFPIFTLPVMVTFPFTLKVPLIALTAFPPPVLLTVPPLSSTVPVPTFIALLPVLAMLIVPLLTLTVAPRALIPCPVAKLLTEPPVTSTMPTNCPFVLIAAFVVAVTEPPLGMRKVPLPSRDTTPN